MEIMWFCFLTLILLRFFQSYFWTLSSFLNFVPPTCKVFYIYSSKFRKWDVDLCGHFLQILAFSIISFPVDQFPRFYWAILLERWEELMKGKHKLGPIWSSSHQKFLSKGMTLSDLCFRTFFYDHCGRQTGGGTWR